MNQQTLIDQAIRKGYSEVQIVTFPPRYRLEEHTHDEEAIHILLSGEMTLIENGKEENLEIGTVFIIAKGTTHHGYVGDKGCSFVVGFKY
jgi:quercetin dioxygenase-like cupin family protein